MTLFILVFLLSLFCLLTAVEKNAFNFDAYIKAYSKYNVMEMTGKSLEELDNITNKLLNYLKGKVGIETLESNFNKREILHMKDVRGLFKRGFILQYLSVILSSVIITFFIINDKKEILGKYLYKGIFISLISIGFFGIIIYSNFDKYFVYFHYIFFRNNLWQLDPKTDLLIQLFPEKFFIDMVKNISLSFLVFMVIIQSIGYSIIRKGWGQNEKRFKIFKRKP
ncbi:TIGR01906 family membrane protein [Tissierella praeacuta]|uniref:TIGR01906 family membrane protein n=1 Tax=Tissierella praeacuta TaxID=43131 RepID=UPI00333F4739